MHGHLRPPRLSIESTHAVPSTAHSRHLDPDRIARDVHAHGFALVESEANLAMLRECAALDADDIKAFQALWGDLPLDTYMADGGRYRYRRFTTLSATPDRTGTSFSVLPSRPFYQAATYNSLNGGVERRYESLSSAALANPVFDPIFKMSSKIVNRLKQVAEWEVELHPIRTICNEDMLGQPTPEGIHRDGVDYFFVFFLDRKDAEGGVSKIFCAEKHEVFCRTLNEPLEFIVVDDRRMYHAVTPIAPLNGLFGHRDVLVLNYRKADREM